jgi:cell division protein FtsL
MPTFESKISLGNLLQIIILLVALVVAWSKLVTHAELADYVRNDIHQLQLQIISAKISDLNAKSDEIQSDVKEIKRAIK